MCCSCLRRISKVPRKVDGPRGAVKFRVTAGNMREPVEEVVLVSISYEDCTLEDEVGAILEEIGA